MKKQKHDRRIDYIEFHSTDIEASKRFYGAVFGWIFKDWGPDYASFRDGRLAGGFRKTGEVISGSPLVVLYAMDLVEIESEEKKHGGKIVEPTFEFPGGKRFHFSDPTGNVLGVWSED